ncbi:MAG TPA: DNA internalization-related competence protein ComEC/Rec2 [Chromatiales bacterium]|nr:DNA internalization-related competence protein ComEC/Rec2 [Chromatiales bacterium]
MWALAFLIGIGVLQLQAQLPPAWLAGAVPALALAGWWLARRRDRGERWMRLVCLAAAGFAWAWLAAWVRLDTGLAPGFEGSDLVVTGRVLGLPEHLERRLRFRFAVEGMAPAEALQGSPPLVVRLNSYGALQALHAGERWRLVVRLKRARGLRNPGAFDYEAWLLTQGIRATGYVRRDPRNRLLEAPSSMMHPAALREAQRERLLRLTDGLPNAPFLLALVLGDRSAVPQDRWRLLLDTGTNHLLAISGLHVGMVAALAGWLTAWLWRRCPRLALRWAAPRAGAMAAVFAALGYAGLAGWSVPTQRAFVMVMAAVGGLILGRALRPARALGLALVAVLALDPFAVLSAGFWLSFAAVAILISVALPRGAARPWWQAGGRATLLVGLGLMPLTLWFFQRAVLYAPLANLWAVPLVSLATVPLALAGTAAGWLWEPGGRFLLWMAGGSLDLLWPVLECVEALPGGLWSSAPRPLAILTALVGLAWGLAPPGWPARAAGWVLVLPLWTSVRGAALPPGQWRATMLDVGQGLSVIVQTAGHALVFDTGPRFSERFNAAQAAVIPALRRLGVHAPDALVVSHGDNDHAGGLEPLLQAYPRMHVWSGDGGLVRERGAQPCTAGTTWRWDGVVFTFVHPPSGWEADENDAACVLRVSASMGALLLASDIEAAAEARLARLPGITAEVLQVPHHGSLSSSSPAFLDAVAPRIALVSAGYRNRWGFPRPEVVARYAARGIRLLDTAGSGAITVGQTPEGGPGVLRRERIDGRHYWTALP